MWSGSRSHANPHRLEASLVLEEHGCCHAGSKLSSSLKDVLAAERSIFQTLSLVGADPVLLSSVKSWELSSHTKIACRLGTPSFPPLPSLLSFPFDAVYRQGLFLLRAFFVAEEEGTRQAQWTPGALVCNMAMLCLLTSSSSCIASRWIPPRDDARCFVFFVLYVSPRGWWTLLTSNLALLFGQYCVMKVP